MGGSSVIKWLDRIEGRRLRESRQDQGGNKGEKESMAMVPVWNLSELGQRCPNSILPLSSRVIEGG